MEVKKVVCIQCHNACRLAATVDGDRLVSVEPDKESLVQNPQITIPVGSKFCFPNAEFRYGYYVATY